MKLLLGGLVLLAACGSVDDTTHPPDAPRRDALSDDAAIDIDAPPSARCDPSKGFGTPVKVDALSSDGADLAATLSSDELTILWTSTRSGGVGSADIYTASRATKTSAWGTASLLANVNTTAAETHPSMTSDGLTLYFEFRLNPNSPLQVMRATRASTAVGFGTPASVTVVNTAGDNGEPYVTPDNSALYFSSTRGTAGTADIYVASGAAGAFGTPVLASGTQLQTTSNEGAPVVTPDQLNIYFRSDRGTSMDVWLATRTSVANGFGAPVNVAAVNLNFPESVDWISADNCVMYFHRDIGSVASSIDIYSVEKPL